MAGAQSFLLLTGIAGVVTSLYALGYARGYEGSRLRVFWAVLWCRSGYVYGIGAAGSAIPASRFWEIMALAFLYAG